MRAEPPNGSCRNRFIGSGTYARKMKIHTSSEPIGSIAGSPTVHTVSDCLFPNCLVRLCSFLYAVFPMHLSKKIAAEISLLQKRNQMRSYLKEALNEILIFTSTMREQEREPPFYEIT